MNKVTAISSETASASRPEGDKGFTRQKSLQDLGGFTIVELLIAAAVFSLVLMILTYALLQIGRTYLKGVTQAKTQEITRSIVSDLSRAIQFNGDSVSSPSTPPPMPGTTKAFCINQQRYSYVLNQQLNAANHGLIVDDFLACPGTTPLPNMNSATPFSPPHPYREVLSQKMRLAKLVVTPLPDNLYQIDVKVIYGDDDLLQDTNGDGIFDNCSNGTHAGGQFCAVSSLSTVVKKRVL